MAASYMKEREVCGCCSCFRVVSKVRNGDKIQQRYQVKGKGKSSIEEGKRVRAGIKEAEEQERTTGNKEE